MIVYLLEICTLSKPSPWGGASRSELKYTDCRWQSHHNTKKVARRRRDGCGEIISISPAKPYRFAFYCTPHQAKIGFHNPIFDSFSPRRSLWLRQTS